MSGELATIQAATTTLDAVVRTTGTIMASIRAQGIVRSAERDALRDHLQAVRKRLQTQEVIRLAGDISRDVTFLYDEADKVSDKLYQYEHRLQVALDATRHTRGILDDLAAQYRRGR